MKKLKNPYNDNSNCFGCSQNNSNGLQMEFFEHEEYIVSNWIPKNYLTGFKNIMHGGIQTTILDEIASWVVFVKCKTAGVTTTLNAKFRNSAYVDGNPFTVKAKLTNQNRRFATIHAQIFSNDGTLCSEAEVIYRIFPQSIAIEKLNYPGVEAFYQ